MLTNGFPNPTITYSTLLNGEPTSSSSPLGELNKGYPLCPFHSFFFLTTKVFSRNLGKVEVVNHIEWIKVCKGSRVLTHLLFASNIFHFVKVIGKNHLNFSSSLNVYISLFSQSINKQKLVIFFLAKIHSTS